MIPDILHFIKNGENGEDNSIMQNSDTILTLNIALNLTGYTAKWQVRPTEDSSTVLLELNSPSDGITISSGATSTLTITFNHTKTNITPGIYVYYLRLNSVSNDKYYIIKGNFEISAGVP